jgi:hypothetical protein
MRLLIYTAVIAVLLLALGARLEFTDGDVRENHAYTVEHVSELGTRIELLERRMDEMNCVHFIYEDGSVLHVDGEVAHRCLQTQLGWP